jgi:hypothetical protein
MDMDMDSEFVKQSARLESWSGIFFTAIAGVCLLCYGLSGLIAMFTKPIEKKKGQIMSEQTIATCMLCFCGIIFLLGAKQTRQVYMEDDEAAVTLGSLNIIKKLGKKF